MTTTVASFVAAIALVTGTPALAGEGAALPPTVCPDADARRCRFAENHRIGMDPRGNHVALVAFDTPDAPGDADDPGCVDLTYGLLHSKRGKVVSFEPLAGARTGCAGGADGEQVGMAGPNRIRVEHRSESNWVYVETTTWEALPVLRQVDSTQLQLYKGTGSSQLTTAGPRTTTVQLTMPDCSPTAGSGALGEYQFTVIPVAHDAAFAASWKSAPFPPQALDITSAGGDGYVIGGRPGKPADARMRVLALSERVLVVEVSDDRFVAGGSSPETDDHLELWAGERLPRYSDICVRRDARAADQEGPGVPVGPAWQWGIRAADGGVSRGQGRPDLLPRVERTARTGAVRFRIELPADYGSVAVVYSDTDDGRRPKRLIGTSKLVPGDPLSLGQIEGAASQGDQ